MDKIVKVISALEESMERMTRTNERLYRVMEEEDKRS